MKKEFELVLQIIHDYVCTWLKTMITEHVYDTCNISHNRYSLKRGIFFPAHEGMGNASS